MNSTARWKLAQRLALVAFGLAGARFISNSACLGSDGRNYFCLFDDGMISMRYARNIAAGLGPVWNPGEWVEGYTNPLWVALMSVACALCTPSTACLMVQMLGLGVWLLLGVSAARTAGDLLDSSSAGVDPELLRLLALIAVLGYFPLAHWSLMGMENGLAALLLMSVARRALEPEAPTPGTLAGLSIWAGLATLTRPDMLVPSTVLAVAALLRCTSAGAFSLRHGLALVGPGLVLVGTHLAWRWRVYGVLVPNTYVLKIVGTPLGVRVADGGHYVAMFIGTLFVMGTLALAAVCPRWPWKRPLSIPWRPAVLAASFAALLVYQVTVGADPFKPWRIVSCGVPLLTLASLGGAVRTCAMVPGAMRLPLLGVLTALMVIEANWRFGDQIVSLTPEARAYNQTNVNIALKLRELLEPGSTVALLWSGTIPYYLDARAVDLLGKCDPVIAGRSPEIFHGTDRSFMGTRTVAGHNKYDLWYSIDTYKPDYTQALRWGRDDLHIRLADTYEVVIVDQLRLILRRNSPRIRWDKVRRQATRTTSLP